MILKCVIIIILTNLSHSFRNTFNRYNNLKYNSLNLFSNESSEKIDWTQTLNLPISNWDFHNFVNVETNSQKKWDSEGTYLKSILNNLQHENITGKIPYDKFRVICDGPPYANGQSHMGHLLNRTIKDIKLRFWLSQGHAAVIVPGWDCHGLPIELKAKQSIGVENLLEKCENLAFESVKNQAISGGRLGCWGFWALSYGTLLPLYKQLVQNTFYHLKDKNIISKGPLPVLYSPVAQSIVADVEVEIKNVIRTCSYIPYEIKDPDKIKSITKFDFNKLFIVAYTTEPWTLFENQGLAVSKDSNYSVYKNDNNLYIMNSSNPYGNWSKLIEIKGSELIQLKYVDPLSGNEYQIIDGENYVIFDVGTGIIHLSGAHNHNDFQLLVKSGVDTFRNVVDENGRLVEHPHISAYSNDLDDLLKSKIDILHIQNVVKKPFCRRTGGNIFTRIIDQYWLNVDKLRSQVLNSIAKMSVQPSSAKNYLNRVVSSRPNHWCLSRQRPWGCKIDNNNNECLDVWFESGLNWMYNSMVLEYLRDYFIPTTFNKSLDDSIGIVKSPGYNFTIGQNEYYNDFNKYVGDNIKLPFLSSNFNNFLMIEGQDQHRGWFQSSLLTQAALGVDLPFSGIFTHGFVINEGDMRKLSKSNLASNQADELLAKYGADSLRLFIASSDFHQKDIILNTLSLERAKDIRNRLCNTFRFILGLKKYNNLGDNDTNSTSTTGSISISNLNTLYPLDESVLRHLLDLQKFAREGYQSFNYSKVVNRLKIFLKYLSSDYLSVIKDVIYTEPAESPRAKSAFETIRFIGIILSQIVAPITPHIAQNFNDLYNITDNLHSKWTEFTVSNKFSNEMNIAHNLRELTTIQLNKAVDKQVLKYFGQARVNIAGNENIKQLVDKWNGKSSEDLRLFLGVATVNAAVNDNNEVKISIEKVQWPKCDRCWLYRESVTNRTINGSEHALCDRCFNVTNRTT